MGILKKTREQKLTVKPLALRYLYRAYKELDENIFRQLLYESARIAKEEGHLEIRANTVRKAMARLTGKDLRTVKRAFFPLRLTRSELEKFRSLIHKLLAEYSEL